jgi:hypothetical protein
MSTAISARAALLSTIPELRACAISLSGSSRELVLLSFCRMRLGDSARA